MENLYTMFESYSQKFDEAHYIQNSQLHKDNQLEELHPDVCDEEFEEISGALTKQNLENHRLKKSEDVCVSCKSYKEVN